MAPVLSGKGVIALILGIVGYHEVFCKEGEYITEEVDRQREKYPVLVSAFIVITAAHLLRKLPPEVDPYAIVGNLKPKGRHI